MLEDRKPGREAEAGAGGLAPDDDNVVIARSERDNGGRYGMEGNGPTTAGDGGTRCDFPRDRSGDFAGDRSGRPVNRVFRHRYLYIYILYHTVDSRSRCQKSYCM